MRRVAVIAVAIVVALALSSTGSAEAQSAEDEIQILGVTEDPAGRLALEIAVPASIGELEPVESNFGLTVDAAPLPFEIAPIEEVVDVVVVLDTSGSMRGESLAAAKDAASVFVERLPDDARVGVVSFGATATVQSAPELGRDVQLRAIGELQATGETALWDALVLAADLVDDLDADRPYVVVLSDGDDTVSVADRSVAVDRLRAAGAGLYAIAMETPDADPSLLNGTVAAVGGHFLSTDSIDELEALYVDTASRLASRYELSFEATADTEHSIVVSVAADGTVATARTLLEGRSPTTDAVPDRPAQVLNVTEAQLGTVAIADPGPLGGVTTLGVGVLAMFAAFAVLGLLMTAPRPHIHLDTAAGADRVAGMNSRLTTATDRFVVSHDADGELDGALDAAGINMRPGEFVLLAVAGVVVASLLTSGIAGLVAGVFVALVTSLSIYLYVAVRRGRRQRQFADQLTDTLTILTGSLRAGRGLPQAIELVADEAPSPTAEQFRRIVFETRVGRDMTTSMLATAKRMNSEDLEWVTRAVDINRELGGDLTEVLDNVATTLRDRRRVARQVRALSAEGRASGWVLLGLPFLMFAFLAWRTPDSAALLTGTPLGQIMLAIAGVGMAVGYVWIRKLVDLKY
ncbi:MAG: VWA domain-containing protein [Acidimicrobiia bacterium]|nr:VWA domain-containing protein [Acidimicrobiia bacterium]